MFVADSLLDCCLRLGGPIHKKVSWFVIWKAIFWNCVFVQLIFSKTDDCIEAINCSLDPAIGIIAEKARNTRYIHFILFMWSILDCLNWIFFTWVVFRSGFSQNLLVVLQPPSVLSKGLKVMFLQRVNDILFPTFQKILRDFYFEVWKVLPALVFCGLSQRLQVRLRPQCSIICPESRVCLVGGMYRFVGFLEVFWPVVWKNLSFFVVSRTLLTLLFGLRSFNA